MRFNYILKLFLVSVVVLMMSACDNGGGGDTGDTTPPTITINGESSINVNQGGTYTEKGAIAIDAVDGTINVTTLGSVDTTKVGSYTITYTAKDSANNESTAKRTVNIVAITASDTTLMDNVHLIDDNNISNIIDKSVQNDSNTSGIVVTKKMADSLKSGEVFYIPAGTDDRFPLGFSGKVETINDNNDGTSQLELSEVGLNEIIESSVSPSSSIPLSADNFVGVIVPSAVQAYEDNTTSTKSNKLANLDIRKSFLNGGVQFLTDTRQKKLDSFIGTGGVKLSGDTNDGVIKLSLEVKLKELVSEATKLKPIGSKAEAKLIVSGTLSNAFISESHDIDIKNPHVELHTHITGELDGDIGLTGGFEATLGNFNRAWKEVEDEAFNKFGIKGKITGLSSDDKVGKYPIIALVFVNPTPISLKTTQTAVRMAKMGGFILWVYANAKGEITIDGSTGVATHGKIDLGIDKVKNKQYVPTHTFTPISGKRLIEAPYIKGEGSLKLTAGLSVHIDTFMGGIRVANLGMDLIGKYALSLNGEGSYGIDKLGDPWTFKGKLCYERNFGAGLLFHADAKFGIKVGYLSAELELEPMQYPSQEDMDNPNNVGWVGTWYKIFDTKKICIPSYQPILTLNGDEHISVVQGTDYEELGATATDEEDGDITDKITQSASQQFALYVSNTNTDIDTSKISSYIITYSVTDSDKNTVTKTRVVDVVSPLDEGDVTTQPMSYRIIYADALTVKSLNHDNPIMLIGTDLENYTLYSDAEHGVVSGTAPDFKYTPNQGYVGDDIIAFKTNNPDDPSVVIVNIHISPADINLTNGLVAYYKFDGDANDSSGNGNNGTEYGGVSYVDGVIGKAGSFDGVDDYVSENTIFSFSGTSTYSISGWFKTSSGGEIFKTTKNAVGTSRSAGLSLSVNSNDGGSFNVSISSDGVDNRMSVYDSSNNYVDGKWHSYVVKYNGSLQYTGIEVFIDGHKKELLHRTGVYIQDNISSDGSHWSSGLQIGRSDDLSGVSYFNGSLDDLRIYNRALNEAEVKELYEMGNQNSTTNIFIVNAIDINGTSFTVPVGKRECTFSAVGNWDECCSLSDANGAGYYHSGAFLSSSPIGSLIMKREDNVFEFVGNSSIKSFSEREKVHFLFNDIAYGDNNGFQSVTWSCR